VRSDGAKTSCQEVPFGTSGCSLGAQLVKNRCNQVSQCPNSTNVTSLAKTFDPNKLKSEADKYVVGQIAQQVKPELGVDLPGFTSQNFQDITLSDPDAAGRRFITIPWLAQYIDRLYTFAVGIAGIVATVMLMVGGFYWITSAGDANRVSQAKTYITSSIVGLTLVLTAFMILNFINPSLTTLNSLKLELPELRIDPDRNPLFLKDCDYLQQTKPIKEKLVKANGKHYCPGYDKLLNVQTVASKYTQIQAGGNYSVTSAVLKSIESIGKLLSDPKNKTKYGDTSLQIRSVDQSLEVQQNLCQQALQSRVTQGSKITTTTDNIPNCSKNKILVGRQLSVRLSGKDSTGATWNCGNTKESETCVGTARNKNNCTNKKAEETCQQELRGLMTTAGFSADPDAWWIFTK
jgi:hypothetical protein